MTNGTSLGGNFELRVSATAEARRMSDQFFFGIVVLLFASSAALTIASCGSMASMGEMPMSGGWTMSMAWMGMPGETWAGLWASFLGMWVVMMVAMMLPSLVPLLWRFRLVTGVRDAMRLHALTLLVGLGYFAVWAALGVAVFPLGVAAAAAEMQFPALARAVPVAAGAIVVIGGALQFTAWKAHHLACCRKVPRLSKAMPADGSSAWHFGLRLGLHCTYGCVGLTAALLAVGVMDLRAMAAVTAAITAERLAPSGKSVARATGVVIAAAGLVMIARAVGLR